MARLNEPPIAPQPSAETIDAVKRRFLRQNRELAKTNSQQSIRIRSLENDCSRLLAENLSLREHVLHLQNMLESQPLRPSFDTIDAVKAKLEAKMMELGGLVAELGNLKKADPRPRRRSQLVATRRSPDERQWRSGLGLQEVENQMLPTITEDKHYPRRTMGADELRDMLEGPETQSPDIGPPPISRLDNEEPIAFNAGQANDEQPDEHADDGEPALSVNLETRKKRRESGPRLNIRRVSVFESPPENTEDGATKTTKTGAKRKFNVQEDEDQNQSKSESFRFSRRNGLALETEASNEDSRSSSAERPVLGSKPVNTDPMVSPKKQRQSAQEKPDKPSAPTAKSRSRPRLNINRTITPPEIPLLPMSEPVLTAEITLDALPPKTPAVEVIFSPPSAEPSTSRPDSKDTPPPGDLSAADQIGAARPGRRARPQVSYKEPSLHTKMRRPDAKLVDAIVDRRTSVDPQTAPPSTSSKPTVKPEGSEELGWKPASAITGRSGEEDAETGSPLRQKLDRRETGQDGKISPATDTMDVKTSTASKAISALISETSTAKRKAVLPTTSAARPSGSSDPKAQSKPADNEPSVKQEEGAKDNLAIFDFTDSSPADTTTNPRTRINELAKAARNARRHSSVPKSSLHEDRKPEKPQGALPTLHKRTGSGNVKSSSTTSLEKSASTTRLNSTKDRKVAALPPSSSSMDLQVKIDVADEERKIRETTALRAERAASRRKSMLI
ncbi:hypothetical protein BDU57DRAFT_489926 [Ampelomyces quisqualis]|uniref:Shugoshin n=1 Tax=Ampelomyces quisqualis TaxID=50730 RepID=A0A6A5R292_AMPQU|nr:hypothetical protein BDU57DRAFT_489926 [Ampelomyces quisqualis]